MVMSSAPLVHIRNQADRLGVGDFFHHWHGGVMDKPALTAQVLREHGWQREETAFVGDMTHDMMAARATGVLGIALLTGYESAQSLLAAEPGILARDLSEVAMLAGDPRRHPLGNRPVATVGALVENERGEWLMIRTHKWSHKWGIPGGKIERGENSEEALRREILEETGLRIQDITFAMVQDCVEPPEFERSAHFLLLNYTAKTNGSAVKLNDEAEEFRWVTPVDVAAMDLNQPTRTLVEFVRRRRPDRPV
jgi:ADP-ribose pyrophosphatase YjhB (NUDIX family)